MTNEAKGLPAKGPCGTRGAAVIRLAIVALAVWLGGGVPAQAADPLAAMGVVTAEQGREAPDFALPDADGKRWALREFRGRPVLLTFFTTW